MLFSHSSQVQFQWKLKHHSTPGNIWSPAPLPSWSMTLEEHVRMLHQTQPATMKVSASQRPPRTGSNICQILQAQFQRTDIQSFLKTKTFRSFFSWTPNSWGIPNPCLFLIILTHSAEHRKCMRLTTSAHTSSRIWRATCAMCIVCPFCRCQSNFKAQKRHCTHLRPNISLLWVKT